MPQRFAWCNNATLPAQGGRARCNNATLPVKELIRDEKEGRTKQVRSNKQGKAKQCSTSKVVSYIQVQRIIRVSHTLTFWCMHSITLYTADYKPNNTFSKQFAYKL